MAVPEPRVPPLPVNVNAPVPSQADYSPQNVAWVIEMLAFSIGENHLNIRFRYENNTPDNPNDDIIVEHPADRLYFPEESICRLISPEHFKYETFAKQSARLKKFEEESPADIKYFIDTCDLGPKLPQMNIDTELVWSDGLSEIGL